MLVAVHAFLIHPTKHRILLSERHNTGYLDGRLSVPAGHVDGGESIGVAMARELKEEVNIDLKVEIGQLLPAHIMHRMHVGQDRQLLEERIDFFYHLTNWSGEPDNAEPEKCARLVWSKLSSLPETIIPYVHTALQHTLAGNHFSEFIEGPGGVSFNAESVEEALKTQGRSRLK